MPIGASRIAFLAKTQITAVAEVIRKQIGITARGNAQIDTAQYKFGGSSLLLDGTGDDIETSYFFTGSETAYTIEMWIRPTAFNNTYNYVYGSYLGGATGRTTLAVKSDGSVFAFVGGTGGGNATSSTGLVSTGTWYHLAFVWDGSNVNVYLDGTSVLNFACSIPSQTTNPVRIGQRGDDTPADEWDGHIDEVRLSNTARYTTSFTPSTTPFVNDDNTLLLLHMNGTDSSTFFEDDNGIRSQVGVSAEGNAQVDTAQSKFGGASALFDGTGDYIATDISSSYDDDFTLETWVRLDVLPSSGTFRMLFAGNSNTEYASIANQSGTYVSNLVIRNSGGSFYETYYTIPSISTNTWYHWAVVKSGSTIKHFFDGTELTTLYSSSGTMASSYGFDGYHYIGRWNGNTSHMVDGYMDEVRISNTARYTTSFTAPTAPFTNDSNTLLLLHMDGTDGSTDFRDDVGDHTTGRTGVLVSAEGDAQVDTAQSKFGGTSALFDNAGDRLVGQNIDFAQAFTVECFARSNGAWDAGTQSIFATELLPLFVSSGKIAMYNTAVRTGTTTMSGDTWYHLVWESDGTNLYMYIDGSYEGNYTLTASQQAEANQQFKIASNWAETTSLDGHIDELRVTQGRRYNVGTGSFTAPTEPFVDDANTLLLLHMDGADGSTSFVDDVGGRSSVGVSANGNAQIDTADSEYGGASALFDGTGDYLLLPNQTFTGDYTIEFWAKPDAATSLQVALRMGHFTGSAWQNHAVFQFRGSSAPSFTSRWNVIYVDGSLGLSTASGGGGVWTHVALSRSGTTTRFFLDGSLIDSVTDATPGQLGGNASTDNITIGSTQTGGLTQDFNGWIDEVRISDTARYTAAFTAPTEPFQNDANTTLLLHMNGTDGSTVFIDDNGKQA